jgi:hypothetical protein
MGILEWSPDQFWRSTPFDLSAAFDGWMEKNGNKDQPEPLTREEMNQLEAEVARAAHGSH